jgi:hypothetical protein
MGNIRYQLRALCETQFYHCVIGKVGQYMDNIVKVRQN